MELRTISPAPIVFDVLRKVKAEQSKWKLRAGEAFNNEWNLIFNLADYANDLIRVDIDEYVPINGVIANSGNWYVQGETYKSSLIDVTDYTGYKCDIYLYGYGRSTRYTFLTAAPVSGQIPSYAHGYSSYVYTNTTVHVTVPDDAKYLLVYLYEEGTDVSPMGVSFRSIEFDYSKVDWDSCCVGEINPDDPFATNDIDRTENNSKLVSMYGSKWYGHFEGKNIYMPIQPYSTTKMLTGVVVVEFLNSSDSVQITSCDFTSGSGDVYSDGETMPFCDAVHYMIKESDNSVADAIGRTAGYKILDGKMLYLLDREVTVQ